MRNRLMLPLTAHQAPMRTSSATRKPTEMIQSTPSTMSPRRRRGISFHYAHRRPETITPFRRRRSWKPPRRRRILFLFSRRHRHCRSYFSRHTTRGFAHRAAIHIADSLGKKRGRRRNSYRHSPSPKSRRCAASCSLSAHGNKERTSAVASSRFSVSALERH